MSFGGGGDIWSTGAFSYESTLKDLLDSGNYTIEQLLGEDELLLELRGCHQQLISILSTEESVTLLIQYIIKPKGALSETTPSLDTNIVQGNKQSSDETFTSMMNGDHTPIIPKEKKIGLCLSETEQESPNLIKSASTSDMELELMRIRYPYMACEIICCEIPSILETIVTGKVLHKGKDTAPHATEIVTTSESDDVEVITSTVPSTNNSLAGDEGTGTVQSLKYKTQNLSSSKDYSNTILDLIFSVLYDTKQGELDDYRAGYLDKVLTVLFRRRPEELSLFLNADGQYRGPEHGSLMQAMLKHLYSHSITQIAQRLLLPQKPTGKPAPSDEEYGSNRGEDDNNDQLILAGGDDSNEAQLQCNWSNSEAPLDFLLETLTGNTGNELRDEELRLDMSLNASEVLITIIQNSMLSSNIMLSLTQSDTVLRIITAATVLPEGIEYFSPHESMLTSAMNVLENLVLQLGGYGALGTMSLLPADDDPQNQIDLSDPTGNQQRANVYVDVFKSDSFDPAHDKKQDEQQQNEDYGNVAESGDDGTYMNDDMYDDDDRHLIADLGSILKHLPFMLDNLSKLLHHPSTKTWTSPMQYSDNTTEPEQQLLGSSRLRIVRLLESLVLLGDQDVDEVLIQQSLCLQTCVDFFWQFQWCSMLHQSVGNLLVHVFEGQNARADMQEFFLYNCDLLGRLMNSFVGGDSDEVSNANNYTDYNTDNKNDKDLVGPRNQNATTLETEIMSTSTEKPQILSDHKMLTVPAQMEGMIVENLNDLNEDVKEGNPTGVELLAAALLESGDMSRGSTHVSDPLPVSEDDVDAAMEQTVEQLSTDAVQFESRDGSVVGAGPVFPVAQSFRNGYMGHVIIMCQALVNAYMSDDDLQEQEMQSQPQHCLDEPTDRSPNEDLPRRNDSFTRSEGGEDDTYVGPKDDLGDPLRLVALITQHPLAERWHEFVATTLVAENANQSTPLGGSYQPTSSTGGMMMMHALHSYRPGLIDEGYMMGDDGDGPPAPPPRGMLGGGDVIDMDDNDLDIAANMMAGMTLGRGGRRRGVRPSRGNTDESGDENDDSQSFGSGSGSADSEKSYNSGETSHEKSGYAFDDPLGKTGGLGIELGKLTQYDHNEYIDSGNEETNQKRTGKNTLEVTDRKQDDNDDDNDTHSSSSEEEEFSENQRNDSEEVPVLDLFAGNFNFNYSDDSTDEKVQQQQQSAQDQTEFADFANFEAAVITMPLTVEKKPTLVDEGAKVDLKVITSSDLKFDDDFGPFSSASTNERQEEVTPFVDFDTGIISSQDDPFRLEPMTSSEFEDVFGGAVDHIDLLVQDEIVDPFSIGAMSERALPMIPDLNPKNEGENNNGTTDSSTPPETYPQPIQESVQESFQQISETTVACEETPDPSPLISEGSGLTSEVKS